MSIKNTVLDRVASSAIRQLDKLSGLMSKISGFSDDKKITLQHELNFLERYIDILNDIYQKKMELMVELENNTDIRIIRIYPFLIQPIVEDIFKSTLNRRDAQQENSLKLLFCPEKSWLKISIREGGGWLKCKTDLRQIASLDKRLAHYNNAMNNIIIRDWGKENGLEVTLQVKLEV